MESRCTNSLGRRTIASLQEIERNRQLHLAHQGNVTKLIPFPVVMLYIVTNLNNFFFV